MKKKEAKLDKTYIGLIIGLIIPIVTFYIYYKLKYNELVFANYIQSLHHYKLLFKILSLCVLTNLPAFYLFLQFKYFRGSRGVVTACFIYAISVMIYRFIN